MAFNFWEAQRKAKGRTTFFVALFLVLILIVAVASEFLMREFAGPDNYDPPLPLVGVGFAVVTILVALYNYVLYKEQGGGYVAESLGARRIHPQTQEFKERQLLNIVEEMAVAASVPIPAVYILPANQINAFAAGLRNDQAAVTVTQGCMNTLTRDELQGVIAHEFGHIYNGDMRISLQIAAMVMGFFVVLYIGLRILQFASYTNLEERDDNGRRGGNPLAIAGFIFILGGVLAWFFGSILKAAISREREYLADACAVQFTRNPGGIANALRKIGKQQISDMPTNGIAFSHLYIDEGSGLSALFATHPPLSKRIAAIEGLTYMPPEWKKDILNQ